MTPKEAKETAKWMHGLFPTMTPEQACICADEFAKHELETVRTAIKEHRFIHEFAELSQIREAICAVKRRRITDHSEQLRQEKSLIAKWDHIAAVIGQLPDDAVNDLKQRALMAMPSDLSEFYASRDPRRSKPLMAEIYELIEAEGSEAA